MSKPKQPPSHPRSQGASNKKVSNQLVTLSSAGVLAVYAAGFVQTKPAAERLAAAEEGQRQRAAQRAADLAAAGVDDDAATSVAAAPTPSEARAPNVTFALPTLPAPPRPAPTAASDAPRETPAGTSAPAAKASGPAATEPAPSSTAPAPPVAAASTPVPAPVEPPAPAAAETLASAPGTSNTPAPGDAPVKRRRYNDGTFLGWGSCRHGDIQAQVVISEGRIVSATIAQCLTRYTCNWIDPIVPQVVARQMYNVDYVSGATDSSYAFSDAVAAALALAKIR